MKSRKIMSFVMSLCILGSVFSTSCISAHAEDEVTEAESIITKSEQLFTYDRKEGPLYFLGNDVVKCDPEYRGEVVIPPLLDESNIGHILKGAFDRCYNVTSVVIPDGYFADPGAYGTFSKGDIKQFYKEGPFYFRCDLEHAVLVRCEIDYSGDVVIPLFVQGLPVLYVAGSAFRGCEDITSITVSPGIGILPYAFSGMGYLEKLAFEGDSYSYDLEWVMGDTVLNELIIDSNYCCPLEKYDYRTVAGCKPITCPFKISIHKGSNIDKYFSRFEKIGEAELCYIEEAEEIEIFESGDVNMDSEVSIADSVAIMNYITNSEKYGLTENQQQLADVVGSGDGITASDALEIQRRGTVASL